MDPTFSVSDFSLLPQPYHDSSIMTMARSAALVRIQSHPKSFANFCKLLILNLQYSNDEFSIYHKWVIIYKFSPNWGVFIDGDLVFQVSLYVMLLRSWYKERLMERYFNMETRYCYKLLRSSEWYIGSYHHPIFHSEKINEACYKRVVPYYNMVWLI